MASNRFRGLVAASALLVLFGASCKEGRKSSKTNSDTPSAQQEKDDEQEDDVSEQSNQDDTGRDDGSQPETDDSMVPSPDCNSHAQSVCEALKDCAPRLLERHFGKVDDCTHDVTQICSEQGGRDIDYDACAASLSEGCSAILTSAGIPLVCLAAPGSKDLGEQCGADQECASLRCKKKEPCGVCAAAAASGEDCTETAECMPGLVCIASKCQQPAPAGAECDAAEPRCQAGVACLDGHCATAGQEGDACGFLTPCDDANGFMCKGSKCVHVPIVGEGEPCGTNVAECGAGTRCDGGVETKVCVKAGRLGDSCTSAACAAPFFCADGECRGLPQGTCEQS